MYTPEAMYTGTNSHPNIKRKAIAWTSIREKKNQNKEPKLSAADVKMEIPVLVQSLKSSILSSTSFQMGKTFWGVASAAVEQT